MDWFCKSLDWFLYDREFRHERVNLKTGKQAFKATETYLLTALEKRISKRDTFIENVRKELIRLRNLLKRIKFQTSKLKSILKK